VRSPKVSDEGVKVSSVLQFEVCVIIADFGIMGYFQEMNSYTSLFYADET